MTLLHNSGGAPRSTIVHVAVDAPAQRRCRALVFRLPSDIDGAHPADLLSLLGHSPTGPNVKPENELRRKLNEHARTMALPTVALVSDQARPKDAIAEGLLDICTVLAKSSAHVYLRDKEPNLLRIRRGITVVLQLPPEWSAKS
jgi:hypothetical protein